MSFSLRFVSGALVAAVTAISGCSAEPMREPQQSSQSKLLAPRALFATKASTETTKTTGVVTWRVYRGRTDFVLTGYDRAGKPVQGAAIAFVKNGDEKVLRARVLDGTFFAGKHVFGGRSSSNRTASAKTLNLFHRAIADMMAVRKALLKQGKIHYVPPAQPPTGLDPNDPNAPMQDPFGTLGQSCGNDLMSMLMGALQCLGGTGGLGNGTNVNMGQLLQCALASQGAASAQGTCGEDPGQLGGGDPYDPYGGTGGAEDPYGQGQQGPEGPDPYGQGEGQGPYGQDPMGQGDPFGKQDCQSCEGPYGDIGMDPNNGGVSYDDQGMGGEGGEGGEGGFGEGY